MARPATLASTRERVIAGADRFAVGRRVAEVERLYTSLVRTERRR
jgi:hypothetical protein